MLTTTQKLLDRVLFVAFCEDRGLLPADSIRKAWEHRDPYHPRPVWENFRGLFRAINDGNPALDIPAYNGGLFAPDPLLDRLNVPDAVCTYFRDLGDYDYRPASAAAVAEAETDRSLIDVDILGHIFEQSITDLERLRDELEGRTPPVGPDIYKPSQKLQAPTELDSDAFVAEVKKLRDRRNPLTAAALRSLRDEYTRTIEPARQLTAEAASLEHRLSDLVNEAYGLTSEEIELVWKTAPPRMPIGRA